MSSNLSFRIAVAASEIVLRKFGSGGSTGALKRDAYMGGLVSSL
jgi:hypothetical protein